MVDFSDYEPAPGMAITGSSASPPAPAPVPSPVPTATRPAPAPVDPDAPRPRFVGGRLRELEIRLDFPIEFDGRTFEAIQLRRPTSAEIGQFIEDLVARIDAGGDATAKFPIFFDEAGARVPDAVLDFLDPDDDERLMKAATDFLPSRLLRLQAAPQPGSTPADGAPTAPTS